MPRRVPVVVELRDLEELAPSASFYNVFRIRLMLALEILAWSGERSDGSVPAPDQAIPRVQNGRKFIEDLLASALILLTINLHFVVLIESLDRSLKQLVLFKSWI
jgi:hypothetical protein